MTYLLDRFPVDRKYKVAMDDVKTNVEKGTKRFEIPHSLYCTIVFKMSRQRSFDSTSYSFISAAAILRPMLSLRVYRHEYTCVLQTF